MPGQTLFWEFLVGDKATAPMTRISGAADRTAVSMDRAAASSERASAGFFGLSKSLAGGAGLAVALGFSVGKAMQFQKSMTMIQTQAGASAKQVKNFSAALLSMSGRVATTPDQLATSLYHVQSALSKVGATSQEKLNTVRIAAEGAKVGMADVEDTTNSLTATLASGIVKFNEAGKAMGMLNAIVGAGDMKFNDLNQALGTGLLVTLKTYGVSLKDAGAALAVFGDNNIRGADAATKLRMAVQDMAKPAAAIVSAGVFPKIGLSVTKLQDTLTQHGLLAALDLLKSKLDAAGITGNKVGAYLLNAFTKRAGAGLAVLLTRLNQVHDAAQTIGKDGQNFGAAWVETTHTASFQMQRLGAEFEAAAITVGDKLLPAVTSVGKFLADTLPRAGGVLSAVFKPIAPAVPMFAKLALAAGAAWAVMRVGGAVMTGLENAWVLGRVKLLELGDSFTAAAAKSLTFASTAKVALGAAGFGLAIGMMTRESSNGTKAIGAFASAATGALMGFQAGGPWGAAIGAGVGLLSNLGTALFGDGNAAAAAARKQAEFRQQVDSLTQSLRQDNGVVAENTKNYIANALQKSGAAAAAQNLGLNLHDLELAASGNIPAQNRLNDAHKTWLGIATRETIATQKIIDKGGVLTVTQKRQQGELAGQYGMWGKVTGAIGGTNTAIGVAIKRLQVHAELLGHATSNASGLSQAERMQNQAVTATSKAIKDATSSLLTYANAELTAMGDSDSFKLGLLQMASTIKTNGTSLSDNTQKGIANRQMIEGLASSLVTWAKDTHMGSSALIEHVRALQSQAHQLGLNSGAVDKMLGKLGLLPRAIRAASGKLNIDTSGAAMEVRTILSLLGNLRGKEQQLGLNNVQHALSLPGSASGGGLPEGVSAVGERGPELVIKNGPTAHVLSNSQSKAFLASTGMRAPGFANGTGLLGLASRYRDWDPRIMAAIAMAESGGRARAHNYNLGTGDNSYGLWQINMLGSMGPARRREFGIRSNVALYDPSVNVRAAHDIWRGSGYGAWSTYNSGAYQQFLGANGPISGGGAGGGGGGWHGPGLPPGVSHHGPKGSKGYWTFGNTRYQSRDAAINAYNSAQQSAQQKLIQSRNSLRSGLHSWIHSFGSPSSERKAFRQLLPELRDLGVGDKVLAHMEAQNKRLDNIIRRRIAAQSRLDQARAKLKSLLQARRQERSTVAGAIGGFFDITTAGAGAHGRVTAGAMEAQQAQALTKIRAWASGIEKLRHMGLSNQYLRQLAEAGPASLPQVQALLQNPRVFKEIQHEQSLINRVERHFSRWEAGQLYNGRIARERETVQDRTQRLHEIEKKQDRLAVKIAQEISKQIPSLHVTGELEISKHGDRVIARIVKTGDHKNKARK